MKNFIINSKLSTHSWTKCLLCTYKLTTNISLKCQLPSLLGMSNSNLLLINFIKFLIKIKWLTSKYLSGIFLSMCWPFKCSSWASRVAWSSSRPTHMSKPGENIMEMLSLNNSAKLHITYNSWSYDLNPILHLRSVLNLDSWSHDWTIWKKFCIRKGDSRTSALCTSPTLHPPSPPTVHQLSKRNGASSRGEQTTLRHSARTVCKPYLQ